MFTLNSIVHSPHRRPQKATFLRLPCKLLLRQVRYVTLLDGTENLLGKLSKYFRSGLVHISIRLSARGRGVHCINADRSCIPCIPTLLMTSLTSIELLVKARFCAIVGQSLLFCCVASAKFTSKSICKMSQLHQEALRRQHVVNKRNVNDLSWWVSYRTVPIQSTVLLCFESASVDSNCTIPYLLFKNQLKLRKSLSVET